IGRPGQPRRAPGCSGDPFHTSHLDNEKRGKGGPAGAIPAAGLHEVVLELARTARVAQLAQCRRLDLADPLAGHVELLAQFLEGAGVPVLEAKAELEDASLAAGQ